MTLPVRAREAVLHPAAVLAAPGRPHAPDVMRRLAPKAARARRATPVFVARTGDAEVEPAPA